MKSLLAILLFPVLTFNLSAATNTAASASYADVNTAMGLCSNGDTLAIPAGTATWSSTLTVTKNISIIGAGTNSTTLSRSGIVMQLNPTIDASVRISGIYFNQTLATASSIKVSAKTQLLRIDNCYFRNGRRTIYPNARWVYGVIDHCYFENCDIAISPEDDGGNSNLAWLRPVLMGTTNFLYIEDNIFRVNSSAATGLNEQIYHFNSARTVTRWCVFDGTGAPDTFYPFEAHGNQQIWGGNTNDTSNSRSTIGGEIYNNVFINTAYRFVYLRGGSWLIYSNRVSNTGGIHLTEEEGWQTSFFSPLDTTYPAQEQITNTFIWFNTNSSGLITGVTLPQGSDSTFIQQDRDYWIRAPQSGDPYYPYAPLVYPHPLVTGIAAIINAGPPVNLRAAR